jgi:hypothetical protein
MGDEEQATETVSRWSVAAALKNRRRPGIACVKACLINPRSTSFGSGLLSGTSSSAALSESFLERLLDDQIRATLEGVASMLPTPLRFVRTRMFESDARPR